MLAPFSDQWTFRMIVEGLFSCQKHKRTGSYFLDHLHFTHSQIMVYPFKSTSNDTKHSENSSTSKENSSDTSVSTTGSPVPKLKNRLVDETRLSPAEAEKLRARRNYNRECATRARKRAKQLSAQLKAQVEDLQADKEELRRSLATMEKQLKILEKQNQSLLLSRLPVNPVQYTNGVTRDAVARVLAMNGNLEDISAHQLNATRFNQYQNRFY
jgi:hypothetical protein